MKKLSLLIVSFCLSLLALAQPPIGNANVGDTYGAKTKVKKAVPISQVPAMLENKNSVNTKVIATVMDVCAKKGCWLKVALNDSTTALVTMKDYAFFLPSAIKGKTVVLNGEAKREVTSVEDLKHFASDAKKSQAEIDAITEPKEEIKFVAKGIVVIQ